MRYWPLLVSVLVLQATGEYAPGGPATYEVATYAYKWRDEGRQDRPVPVRCYVPKDCAGPAPVVIFSHGLGGSREGYAYFGAYMAARGYVCVHVGHEGSDGEAIQRAMAAGQPLLAALQHVAADVESISNRPKDISYAIDQVVKRSASGEFPCRVDKGHIAAAGHSFGGYTAMAVAGQARGALNFRDARVVCAIAMSAPPPKAADAYAGIDIPILMMTGTLDDSPITGGTAIGRVQSFAQLGLADRYLAVFHGGDHMVFSGGAENLARLRLPGTGGDRSRDKEFQQHVLTLSAAFLDAYLREDKDAKAWLQSPSGAKASLGKIADWTWKAGK
jgi:predicted dienelactone hydrolase